MNKNKKPITKLSQITFDDNVEISSKEEYDKICEIVNKSNFKFEFLSDCDNFEQYLNKDGCKIVLHGFEPNVDSSLSISTTKNLENEFTPASYFIENYEKE